MTTACKIASTFLESPLPSHDDQETSGSTNNNNAQPDRGEISAAAAAAAASTAVAASAAAGETARRARKRQRGDRTRGRSEFDGGLVTRTGHRLTSFARHVQRVPAAAMEPEIIMKIATATTVSGGVCLLVTIFSGPALVFLAFITVGLCGISYSIRQRGALQLLPTGVVNLLTRTTLLEFLTDTSVFDAVKNYLVFMMGLSPEETQKVLSTLPEDMQNTLTRPGLLHTLPLSLQSVLLPTQDISPPSAHTVGSLDIDGRADRLLRSGNGDREVTGRDGRRRRRQRTAVEVRERRDVYDGVRGRDSGAAAQGGRLALETGEVARAEEEDPPLGLLVWNPDPINGIVIPPAVGGRAEGRNGGYGGGDAGRRERGQHSEQEGGGYVEIDDGVGGDSEDGGGAVGIAGDQDGRGARGSRGSEHGRSGEEKEGDAYEEEGEHIAFGNFDGGSRNDATDDDHMARDRDDSDGGTHGRYRSARRPWDSPPARSRGPLVAAAAGRSADGASAHPWPRFRRSNSDGDRSSSHDLSVARPEQSRRRAVSSARGGGQGAVDGGGGARAGLAPGLALVRANEVPSAERIMVSIIQARVDSAVMAAWNAVDQAKLRRAAIGSGVALAAHVALSKRARRQAGHMLRGGVLAGLAGTVTVCAGLAYLNPMNRPRNDDCNENIAEAPRIPPVAPAASSPSRTRWRSDGRPVSVDDGGDVQGERLAIVSRARRLQRWIGRLKPSTQQLIRLLGMICLLLAVRKWQLLRRAAMRAVASRTMYGSPPL